MSNEYNDWMRDTQVDELLARVKELEASLLASREEVKVLQRNYDLVAGISENRRKELKASRERESRYKTALEKLADPRSWFHIMNYDGVDASKAPITGWCDIGTEPDEIAQEALTKEEV